MANRPTLDALLAAIDLSATSTTKFREVRALLATKIGVDVDDVYIAYVSKAGNLSVRFEQSSNAAKPIGVAVCKASAGSVEHQRTVEAGIRLVGNADFPPTLVICAKRADAWQITDIIDVPTAPSGKAVRAAFPEAATHRGHGSAAAKTVAPAAAPAPVDVDGLADELFVSREWLEEVLWLLEDRRKAIIFYGPPGTGKTFIARKIAEYLQPQPRWRRLVQLHPSYGYEDFFEGYRPAGNDAGLALTKVPGPLRHLADQADEHGAERMVLVLDEVNRGNLPRVFGELYFLIEYRSETVSLMYSPDEDFSLPPNLYMIGTMNTSDRSVAVLDQALRRRFHFVPLFPGEPPIDQMLRKYFDRHLPSMRWVADVLDLANEKIERHARIGPSHFMRADLDERVLERVWKYSVLPTIEELYFGREEDLAQLSLERLHDVLRGKSRG